MRFLVGISAPWKRKARQQFHHFIIFLVSIIAATCFISSLMRHITTDFLDHCSTTYVSLKTFISLENILGSVQKGY